MRILIVEDEPPAAEYIERCIRSIIENKIKNIQISHTLEDAIIYLQKAQIDLCFLDLNLSGEDGYDILRHALSKSFHTIIISAHSDQAIKAFEYGVIDFIPKPFNIERLRKAFDRYFGQAEHHRQTKFLVYRKANKNYLLPIKEVMYFEAARILVEAHLQDRKMELIEKSLNRLEEILPAHFVRIHRSYIVNLNYITSYQHSGRSVYKVLLKDGQTLPISRHRIKAVNKLLNK